MISKKLITELEKLLEKIPATWDQFLCDIKLNSLLKIPGPKYGKVEFDGFSEIPWDFKAHPDKNANGHKNKSIIVNDRLAIVVAIKQFGGAGLILAIGDAVYNDQNRSFQIWHQKLKGGLSNYEKERILRKAPSRLRKTAFKLKEIRLILLDDKSVQGLGSFQEGFRNSDGSPRNAKMLLTMENIPAEKVIKFE